MYLENADVQHISALGCAPRREASGSTVTGSPLVSSSFSDQKNSQRVFPGFLIDVRDCQRKYNSQQMSITYLRGARNSNYFFPLCFSSRLFSIHRKDTNRSRVVRKYSKLLKKMFWNRTSMDRWSWIASKESTHLVSQYEAQGSVTWEKNELVLRRWKGMF